MARISSVRFTRAHTGGGLLGWASFVLDGELSIDGVAIRRTLLGELVLSWPGRKGAGGIVFHHVRPVDDSARRGLEGELLAHLHGHLRAGGAA